MRLAKHRWIIERDYQELKQELGLGHYEGRVGTAFTTMPASALRLTGTWSQNGAVFPPPLVPDTWTYPLPKCRRYSTLGARPIRTERHNPVRSLLCGKPLHAFCSGNYRVALFVELPFYNTVVLDR